MCKITMGENLIFVAFLLLTLTTQVLGNNCTCEQEEDPENKTEALRFKLIALASILIAGGIGVSLPFAGKFIPALQPQKDGFFIVKAFAAGVILATGFIHILPDAFESLTSPCLNQHPWADFPFTGFVAMVATIITLSFETSSAAYQLRAQLEKPGSPGGDEERYQRHDGHTHGPMLSTHVDHSSDLTQIQRYRIVSTALELGITVHSIIIGLSLGASQNPKTIKPLIVALSFHQFFEGLGLGGCIFQAKIRSLAVIIMGAFFTLTTPSGIVIGILISKSYDENSSTALIVEGILNAASAGILIYMALVDLLSPDFTSPRMQNNKILHLCSNISLLLGAGLMSLLAKWA